MHMKRIGVKGMLGKPVCDTETGRLQVRRRLRNVQTSQNNHKCTRRMSIVMR